jgi:hypothetical protein
MHVVLIALSNFVALSWSVIVRMCGATETGASYFLSELNVFFF